MIPTGPGLRLNLGCGPLRLPGEIGVDSAATSAADVHASILDLPFADGAAVFVRLDHVLEHLPVRLVPTALAEAFRVLAPGGQIHIGLPDLAACCLAYLSTDSLADKAAILRWFYGSQTHSGEFHQSGWDQQTARDLLMSAGFTEIVVQPDPDRTEGACLQADAVRP